MADIFKSKEFPSGKLPEFDVTQVNGAEPRFAGQSDDARLPGARKNWRAGVENVQRPRFGKMAD